MTATSRSGDPLPRDLSLTVVVLRVITPAPRSDRLLRTGVGRRSLETFYSRTLALEEVERLARVERTLQDPRPMKKTSSSLELKLDAKGFYFLTHNADLHVQL